MSVSSDQIAQAIKTIEAQLAILKQATGQQGNQTAIEGIVGIFDGEFMVEENGKRHQVPPNYASKTMLVPGDTVKMIEDPNGGQNKYKQIGKADRAKSSGILVKKDGKFEVLTDVGSFKVLSAAIKHYNGEVGDLVYVQFPKNHVKGSYAAVEKVVSQQESSGAADSASTASEVAPVLSEPTSIATELPAATPQTATEPAPPKTKTDNQEGDAGAKTSGKAAPRVSIPDVMPLDSATPNIVEDDDDELV